MSEKDRSQDKPKDYRKTVKKQIKEWLELIVAAEQAPPSELLYGGDGELGERLLNSLPSLLKVQLQLAVDTMDHVAALPEEKRREVVSGWNQSLSALPLGEAVNSYFNLSRKLWESEGARMAEAESGLAEKAIAEIDFGKLRKAVEVKLAARYPVWEGIVDKLVSDPIVIANLLTTLPPVLNNLIRLLSFAVSRLDLPSEILASAVFNMLEELDVEELARLTSGIGATVNALHQGNLILGRSEPRFREVAARLVERYLREVDWRANHDALVALSEDLEELLKAFFDAVSSRPEIMADGVRCALGMLGAFTRAGSHLSLKLQEMPDDFYGEWARLLLEESELREAGVMLNSLLKAHNRLAEADPELGAKLLEAALAPLDPQELWKASREGARQLFTWLARRPDLTSWLEPQEAGRLANSLLAAYNRSVWASGSIRDYAAAKLSRVDASELERAARSAGKQVAQALAERPEVLMALLKAGAASAWEIAKGLARALRPGGKRLGRS